MCSDRKVFSVNVNDYRLLEEIGNGGSATVYKAIYIPTNELVAVKRLDLDRCNSNLDDIRKEAQTMCLIDHPNIIKAYCSFVVEQYLWVVMAFMAEGSCLHLMKVAYPDGFEESVIGTVLKETLKALGYLHRHGHIHRDIKAGNILLDSNGMVKLGDFGVSACMFDHGDRQRLRNTFVGTPCWMAPEVLQPGSGGYDFKADIWSFGITALELAHGHAPFSKYPPMKVLLMTIQNAPPGLDYDRDKKFSKSFKEMVSMCLVKDQTKRPTAEKLLKHPFFKNAKPPEHSIKSLLIGLPPFAERVKTLNLKDAAQLALKKMPSSEQEALSQSEYKRGVSAWKFDIEDLKAQASLEEDDESMRSCVNSKDASTFNFNMGKSISMTDIDDRLEKENQSAHAKSKHDIRKAPSFSGPLMLPSRASANSFSAPIRSSVGLRDSVDEKSKANVVQIKGRFSVTSETVDLEKDIPLGSVSRRCTQESLLRKSASVGDWQVDSKHMPSNQLPKEVSNRAVTASILKPQLHNLFQQTTFQQALIVNLLNELEQTEAVDAVQTEKLSMGPCNLEIDAGVEAAVSAREQLLLMKISELEASTTNLTNELAEARSKNLLLQQQLHAACSREEERIAEEGTT